MGRASASRGRVSIRGCGFVLALVSLAAGAQPSAPASLRAAPGDEAAVLTWHRADNPAIARYQVRFGAGESPQFNAWEDVPGSGARTDTHTVSELTNGTRYTFELRAVDDDGAGAAASASIALAASPSSIVAVPDAALRDLLASEARTGNAPITQGDLAKLTGLSGERGIADLTGLEFALNLEVLSLKSNRIDDISALSSLHALWRLDLSYNEIVDISALAGLSDLSEIELNNNAISDVSALSGLPALRTLELWDNEISALDLSELPALTSLNVGHNQLSDVRLSGLPALTILELRHNEIADISALSGLTALQYLDLTDNQVADVSALSALPLESLKLAGNELTDVSALSGMTTLAGLNLRDNKISDLRLSGLLWLHELEVFGNDLSSVSLSHLFLLRELRVGHGEITDISLHRLPSLRVLGLAYNEISDVSNLSELPALQDLNLTANRIADISPLAQFTALRWLQLASNEVSDLSPLSQLTALTTLDLSFNQVTDISPLSGLTALRGLWLGGNQVSDISALARMGLLGLLVLTANEVTDISVLSGLPTLGQISLSGNQLSDISALAGRTRLRELWLSGNEIADISALAELPALTTLRLDGNAISDISALADLETLSTVFLNRNAVVDLSPLVASGMADVDAYLDLRGNPQNAAQADQVRALREDGAAVLVDDGGHRVPLFRSAASSSAESPAVGFVRVINHSDEAGRVSIEAVDEIGERRGPVFFAIAAGQARHFNAADLEQGNPAKGLRGVGEPRGHWRLVLRSELDIEVLGYARTPDGFVTSLHDLAAEAYGTSWMPTFNQARNQNGASGLRLVNPTDWERRASIRSWDDMAVYGHGSNTTIFAAPRRTLNITSAYLASAGPLGGDSDKYRLTVDSPAHRMMSLLQSPAGHVTNMSTRTAASAWRVRAHSSWERGGRYRVPLLPSATGDIPGFLRIANLSHRKQAAISLRAFDGSGAEYEPTLLTLARGETLHLSSADLEQGNAAKGVSAIGAGTGDWHLEVTGDRRFEVLAYAGMADGFFTSMHDVAPRMEDGSLWVPFLNPGSNRRQASRLRLVNWGDAAAQAMITGVDDAGASPGDAVRVTVPARSARDYMSWELETGSGEGMAGAFGDGKGKWRLRVSTTGDIDAMSLLNLPTGHIANVSTTPFAPAQTKLAPP